jgi:hypothetical protein
MLGHASYSKMSHHRKDTATVEGRIIKFTNEENGIQRKPNVHTGTQVV